MNRGQARLLLAFGVLWTLPNTLIGAIVGVSAIPFGARPKFRKRDLALVFHRFPLGPGGAMTLGNVVLSTDAHLDSLCTTYAHRAGWCVQPKTRIGDHERAHVLQYMTLGPLFLPLYLLFGGINVRNCFERAADRYALTGRDWWPWLKVNSKAAVMQNASSSRLG